MLSVEIISSWDNYSYNQWIRIISCNVYEF